MSDTAELDVRLPMGLMFTILGVILCGFGMFSDRGIYSVSLGINVNLWWGAVILLFGVVMILLARRARTRVPLAELPVIDPLTEEAQHKP